MKYETAYARPVLRRKRGAGILRTKTEEARYCVQQRLKRCAGVPAWASPHLLREYASQTSFSRETLCENHKQEPS